MSRPRVAVITRCYNTKEVISALTTFPALDDVKAVLVLLMDSHFDVELNRYAAENSAMIIFIRDIKATFSLRDALAESDDQLKYVAFWPRRGIFSRTAGLSTAIAFLNKTNADIISGLVRYDMNWQSEAGSLHVVNQGKSLFVAPAELEDYTWQPAGAHNIAEVDTGGSLLVTNLELLPRNLPLMAESISWGLQLILAQNDLKALSSKLFTGFQTTTSLHENQCTDPNGRDAAILYDFLMQYSLIEIVLFGKGRLTRDDDYDRVNFQHIGFLGPEGDEKGQVDLSSFYRATVNHAIIGPLYNLDDDRQPQMVPNSQLVKARQTITSEKQKTIKAVINSIHTTQTKDLLILILKRLYRKFIKGHSKE